MKYQFVFVLLMQSFFLNAEPALAVKKFLETSPETIEESMDNLDSLQKLKKDGFLDENANVQGDYYHVYFPKKEIVIFGAKLVALNHEYLTDYIGCCVNPGISVVLKKVDGFNSNEIDVFSKRNSCKINDIEKVYLPDSVIKQIDIVKDKAFLFELSCKQNDKSHEY